MPMNEDEIVAIERELIRRNNLTEGLVYLQVTRGDGRDRDFVPAKGMKPSVVLFTQEANLLDKPALKNRCPCCWMMALLEAPRHQDGLFAAASACQKSPRTPVGCDEAWMIKDGL